MTLPGVTATFVDGPHAGDVRTVAVGGDGAPPMTLKVPDGSDRAGAFVLYELVTLGARSGESARYRLFETPSSTYS